MIQRPHVKVKDLEDAYLEDAYREILEVEVERVPVEMLDLRQPRANRVVRTVTTYGAYEEPI